LKIDTMEGGGQRLNKKAGRADLEGRATGLIEWSLYVTRQKRRKQPENREGSMTHNLPMDDNPDAAISAIANLKRIIDRQHHRRLGVHAQMLRQAAKHLHQRRAGIDEMVDDGFTLHLLLSPRRRKGRAA
jgi:hypothetical protein